MFGDDAVAVYELAPLETPPVQTGVQVDGVADPTKVTVGAAQVIVCEPLVDTVGEAIFCRTVWLPVDLHPLEVFVTV